MEQQRSSSSRAIAETVILPLVAVAFATAIFAIDTFTPLGLAVAVLYALVVLMAGRFLDRRGVLAVALACVALTAMSFLLQHGLSYGASLARCLVSILAIVITTFLALKSQSATLTLREQASLLDISHDAIIARDLNDVITYWNRGAEQLYGWPREEAIGKVPHELIRTVFPVPLAEIKATLLATDRWEGELIHTKRDGTEVVVASRWSVQRDASGRPVAVLETNNNVTERKLAEAQARQQERELQLTIDSIPTLAWQTGPDGDAQYLSKQWLDYTGLSPEEALGWKWTAAIHPDDLPGLLAAWEKIRTEGVSAETEARFRRFDGEFRWFLFGCEPLRDETGHVMKWYGANTDIEDRKRAEDALRLSEANLAEAQKLSQTGSFSWNVESGEIRWSDEAFRIFEHDPKVAPTIELVIERTHPDDRGLLKRLVERVTRNSDNWEVEHRLLMPDGSVKHVHVVAHPLDNALGRPEYVGALMDVTAEKRSQEALHQAQAELAHVTRVTTLGELTASIAHEVNQPLAAIITNGEACIRWLGNETPNLEEARGAVERMIRDGNRAGEVIQRLRALTKKTDPQNAPLDINDVINDVVGLVQREILSHRVRLKLDLDMALNPILGDRVQLQQVIINLVVNSIEAMANVAERQRELMIRARKHDKAHVLVLVQDSGVGIDAEMLDCVFNAFFTTKLDGMGMGLSICRSIIEAHGGALWASANDGPGITFQFTVPFARVAAS